MEKAVEAILNRHNLKLDVYVRRPDGGTNRSYIIYVNSIHGKKYTLKLFSSDDISAKQRFINEIDSIRFLKKSLKNGYKCWVPTLKYYSSQNADPYYIYERVEGEPFGRFVYDYGYQWGIFKHNNFDLFLNFIDVVEGLTPDSSTSLSRWGSRHARKELQYYFENVSGLLPSELYDKVNAFYERYSDYISKAKVMSHRDLYPENILIQSPGSSKITFLDWEYFGAVPIGYNAAFLYLSFWKEEYWKAKVFSHFYNKYQGNKEQMRQFFISFRFCLSILAVRFIYQIETYGKGKSDIENHARESFLYDLNHAITGEILKPRNIKFFINIDDIQKVAQDYELGAVKSYEIFYSSKGNTVAKVVLSDKRVLIFRFYSMSRSTALIKRELKMFEKLRKNGIGTYEIIHTKEGKLYLEKELYGKYRKIAVLTYVKGKKLHRKWATSTAIIGAGDQLRKIHSQNIIHGDYSKENVLYIKGKITGVIDLEWGRITSSKEAKLHDLAKAIALWMIDTRSKQLEDREMVKYFIFGYYQGVITIHAFDKLMQAILLKIEAERNIFLTTIDVKSGENHGSRFDHASAVINSLISDCKDLDTFLRFRSN